MCLRSCVIACLRPFLFDKKNYIFIILVKVAAVVTILVGLVAVTIIVIV